MTKPMVTPLDALGKRSDELIAQMLGLNEKEKQQFDKASESARRALKAMMEVNNANRR